MRPRRSSIERRLVVDTDDLPIWEINGSQDGLMSSSLSGSEEDSPGEEAGGGQRTGRLPLEVAHCTNAQVHRHWFWIRWICNRPKLMFSK